MPSVDRVYAALRDNVLGKLQEHEVIKFEPEDPIALTQLEGLNLANTFFVQVLEFAQRVKLVQLLDELTAKSPDGKGVNYYFNDDLTAIIWIISNGVVDEYGAYFFSEDDAIRFNSKYSLVVYELAWAVLRANNLQMKQTLVGNSEGTPLPENSSGQPAT